METLITQNTNKNFIFRLFKTDVKADYFHFSYQRTVSSQKKHHTKSNKYLFRHFFLYTLDLSV